MRFVFYLSNSPYANVCQAADNQLLEFGIDDWPKEGVTDNLCTFVPCNPTNHT